MNKSTSNKIGEIIVYAIAICVLQMIVLNSMRIDLDILWHFKLGEEIINNHSISLANSMSFIANTEWIPQEWLYETLLYGVITVGGLFGYLLLFGINSSIMIVAPYASNNIKSKLLYCIVSLYFIVFSARNRGSRPAEFSVYLIVFMIILYNKEQKNINKLLYAILGLVTANFHGGVLLIMVAIHFIMIISDTLVDIYNKDKTFIKTYIDKVLNLIILLIASCINPAGIRLLTTITKIHTLDSTKYIQEWLPLENKYVVVVILLLIVISFGYYIGNKGINKKDIRIIMVNMGLMCLALHSKKAMLPFSIVWLFFGYRYLEYFILDVLSKTSIRFKYKPRFRYWNLLFAGILLCISITQLTTMTNRTFDEFVMQKVDKGIISELEDRYTDGVKIMASYHNGNYILYKDMKCFVDTRQCPYAKEISNNSAVDDLFKVCTDTEDWETIDSIIMTYDFDYIWTDEELNIANYLYNSNRYELVYESTENKDKLWVKK